MASTTLAFNPLQQRHQLTPMRSRALMNLQTPKNAPSPTKALAGGKRALEIHDENVDPRGSRLSPKRVKGLKDDIFDSPPVRSLLRERAPLQSIPTPQPSTPTKRPLSDNVSKKASSSPIQKTPTTTRTTRVPSSLRRGTNQSPLRTPKRRPIRRIDPPTLSRPVSSIDDVFSSPPSLTFSSSPAPAEPLLPSLPPTPVKITPMPTSSMPESWFFEIHEESPTEQLQNLVDFSTSILDISDESDNEDYSATKDLQKRGKENVPPAELTRLQAAAAREEEDAKLKPTKRITRSSTRKSSSSSSRSSNTSSNSNVAKAANPSKVEKKPKRKALGEMDIQKLYPDPSKPAAPVKKVERVPLKVVQEEEEEDGPGFMIWEECGEGDSLVMVTAPPSPSGSQC